MPAGEFVRPDFDAPLDVAAALARVPPGATVKGMFFKALRQSRLPDILEQRCLPFFDYGMDEFMRACVAVAEQAHPGTALREALRRVGANAYRTFAETMAGRVIFGVLGNDIDRVLGAGPKAYRIAVRPIDVSAQQIASGHWRYTFREAYNFLDCYHIGVLEGAVRFHGGQPDVRIRPVSPTEADIDIRWA